VSTSNAIVFLAENHLRPNRNASNYIEIDRLQHGTIRAALAQSENAIETIIIYYGISRGN